MEFDKQSYLREMAQLISDTEKRLTTEHPGLEIYTISVCTDPDAGVSAVNVDIIENSTAVVERYNEWAKNQRDECVAEGDWETAESFASLEGRNYGVRSFALKEVSRIEHQSFPLHWAADTDGQCWEVLEPALLEVGEMAVQVFSRLNLHAGAELSVNSRADWYDHAWQLRDKQAK